jgi:Putative beta barrel porin-7 (BBP7)
MARFQGLLRAIARARTPSCLATYPPTLTAALLLCPGVGNSPANAQAPAEPLSASADCVPGLVSEASASCRTPAPRFYGGIEYLHWWVKSAPLSVPLVSTGPDTNEEGFLVNSASTILYGAPFSPAVGGNDTQNFPGFSGGRLTLGYVLDEERKLAAETRFFMLQSRSAGFTAEANSTDFGGSGMRIPVFNTVPYTPGSDTDLMVSENGLPVFIPGILAGKVSITNSLKLWGADATAVYSVYRSSRWELSALAGFRYLDLSENFDLSDALVGQSGPFVGQSGTVSDHFGTTNQFFGAAIGLRGGASWGPVSLSVTGRIALGPSHEVLNVSGGFQAVNFTASSGSQGIFAQPSNSGSHSSTVFAVVPEVEVKLGFDVTPTVRLTLGYDFIYYSSVVRPGYQLNRDLPKGQVFEQGGTSVSSTSPFPLFDRTSFFAQGLSLGVAVRF